MTQLNELGIVKTKIDRADPVAVERLVVDSGEELVDSVVDWPESHPPYIHNISSNSPSSMI